jgi:hypothetical protein
MLKIALILISYCIVFSAVSGSNIILLQICQQLNLTDLMQK